MFDLIEYTVTSSTAKDYDWLKGKDAAETAKIKQLQKAIGVTETGEFTEMDLKVLNDKLETSYTLTQVANNMDAVIKKAESFWTPMRKRWGIGLGIVAALGGLWLWKRRQRGGYAPQPVGGLSAHQTRFGMAAKSCSGRPGAQFRACMSRKLRGR